MLSLELGTLFVLLFFFTKAGLIKLCLANPVLPGFEAGFLDFQNLI